MAYILIVTYASMLHHIAFDNSTACEAARKALSENLYAHRTICVRRG